MLFECRPDPRAPRREILIRRYVPAVLSIRYSAVSASAHSVLPDDVTAHR